MGQFFNVLAGSLGMILFFLAQLAGVLMIPFGLPGMFLQVLAAVILILATGGARLGWAWAGVFLALASLGELVDFLSGQWGARRFGGSKKAAWGAVAGGFLGLLCGGLIPIPLIGSVVASFIGTFGGAILGEMQAAKGAAPNLRVGCGAVLGRALGTGAKLFLAFLIAIISTIVVVHNMWIL
ncbi:MAG: DUF456 domain-containing protein [Planctomycetota bacterium]